MDLGFQANYGPLSQISIQLFSPETAVHFAIRSLGWIQAKFQAQTLTGVLKARHADLATLNVFHLSEYSRIRSQYPTYGAARQPGGNLVTLELPLASSSQDGSPGMICLYAIVTALLCFFDVEGTCAILMEIVPEYLIHYEQDDTLLNSDGPLYSAMRSFIKAIDAEEKINKTRESLLRELDKDCASIFVMSLSVIREGEMIDSRQVSSLLAWIATPYAKRKNSVYPTRSFLVWAVAYLMSHLGFGVTASNIPVNTKEQYSSIFDGPEVHGLMVHFVGASVGDTDPMLRTKLPVKVAPLFRVVTIRTIPSLELSHIFFKDQGKLEKLVTIWKYTFNHAQVYLRALPHIQEMIGTRGWMQSGERMDSGRRETENLTTYQTAGLQELSKSWSRSSPGSLQELLSLPISKFIDRCCYDCTVDEIAETCWAEPTEDAATAAHDHNGMGKLIMKAILLASAYAIVTLFVQDGDSPAGLDTEVVIATTGHKDLSNCFALKDWCFHMMSVAAVGKAQKKSTVSLKGRSQLLAAIFEAMNGFEKGQFTSPGSFGCYNNGISLVSKFLLDPLYPHASYIFVRRFGQILDFPLDENGLISSVEQPQKLNDFAFSCELPTSVHDAGLWTGDQTKVHPNLLTRWDVEPDWQNDESQVHFRCRINGIPQCTLSPSRVLEDLSTVHRVPCENGGQCAADTSRQGQGLTDDSLCCFNIPFTQIRQSGHTIMALSFLRAKVSVRRCVAIIRAGDDPLEHVLALYTKCQSGWTKPIPAVVKYLTECLYCGLRAIQGLEDRGNKLHLVVLASDSSQT